MALAILSLITFLEKKNERELTLLTLMCCVFFSWLSLRKVHKSERLNIKRIIQF